MALKVAILGLSASSHGQAPWDDPEWELWGLPWDTDRLRFHRTFEMHQPEELNRWYDFPEYRKRLADCANLYMHETYRDVPNSIRYPREAVERTVGDYFQSSLAYPMALAIHEGAQEIGLFGVDMEAAAEYRGQRPNMEYLVGLARGKGIKVHIPESSPLCKFKPEFGYTHRYGWLE